MPRATTIKKRNQKRWKPAGTDSHKKVRKSCKKCPIEHTVNEDRFHGLGSFEETHVGYCRLNCCGSQEDSPCYNPKTRAKQVEMKKAFWKARANPKKGKLFINSKKTKRSKIKRKRKK